jgi:hypothetical protein
MQKKRKVTRSVFFAKKKNATLVFIANVALTNAYKTSKRKQAHFILVVAKLHLTCRRKYKTKSQVPNGRKCGETVYVVPSGKHESLTIA